jgi:hypothetical protein
MLSFAERSPDRAGSTGRRQRCAAGGRGGVVEDGVPLGCWLAGLLACLLACLPACLLCSLRSVRLAQRLRLTVAGAASCAVSSPPLNDVQRALIR